MAIFSAPKKRFLVEEHTGAWCPPCGSVGKPTMEALIEKYPDEVIAVELHNASTGRVDPMAISEQQTVAGALGLTGFPYGSIDRMMFNDGQKNVFFIYPTSWDGVIAQLIPTTQPVVEVKLFYSINTSTRELSATIEANFLQAVAPAQNGELRFNVYVLEDNIIYSQAGNSSNFSHQNVCRTMLGGAWGTAGLIPNSVSSGQTYSHTYKYTLNQAWNIDNLKFVGIVQEYHSTYADVKKILNSVRGTQGAPSSELTSTGPTISVKATGTPFSKVFSLKNVSGERTTYRINEEVSARTPSNWTAKLITTNGIVTKSEKTQAAEITVDAGATVDFTLELTPGATLGIGDASIEVFNKYDPTGQRSSGKITAVSAEIQYCQINDYQESQYSLLSQMSSAGLTNPVELSNSEFEDVGSSLNNLSILVWNCGEKGSLTSSEATRINSAINDGINVFMVGAILANSTDASVKSMLNYAGVQFLKQAFQGAGDGKINIIGYQDDPISNGFDQSCTLINYLAPALKAVGPTAAPFLRFKNVDTVVAIRSTINETKVIVMGLNPFAITNSYERNNLVNKCIQWLQGVGPAISCVEDFGFTSTESGQTSEKTLTIENKGKSPLTVTDVEVEYEFSTNFMVKGSKNFTIPANQTYDLVLQFKPSYAIQYDSWIRIYSNAENAPIKQVNLTGTGKQASAGPVISLSVSNLSFTDVGVGTSDSKTFRINNTGNQDLTVTNINVPGAYTPLFSIDPTAFTVAAGANQTVTVTFNPTDVLSLETNLTITSNNKGGTVQMPITANAIVGVEDGSTVSDLLKLNAVPNPMTVNSKIEFTLNGNMAQQVEIVVLDASGRTVKTISNKSFEPGTYTFDLNSSDISSGTYYVIAKSNGYSTQLPLVVVK